MADWVGVTFVDDVLSSGVGIVGTNVFTGPVILFCHSCSAWIYVSYCKRRLAVILYCVVV